ncbi:MAG: hypothetical protein JNM56_14770 [Planctomycetia bacterium]|nr:hypothetical protein [Planctomycetia bacterium]
MPPFRTVNGSRAGPRALGVLVPPGNRTLVVLRPRALDVDLVLVRREANGTWGSSFLEAERLSAGLEAQKLQRALLQWAEGVAPGQVQIVPLTDGTGWCVRVEVDALPLIACGRVPGQPYRPLVLATREAAETTAAALAGFLCPEADAEQELYTNLSMFGRG